MATGFARCLRRRCRALPRSARRFWTRRVRVTARCGRRWNRCWAASSRRNHSCSGRRGRGRPIASRARWGWKRVYCATDDLLRNHTSELEQLAAVRAADVRYTLTEFKRGGNGTRRWNGTLASVTSGGELETGLYRLELGVSRPGASPVQGTSWLLFAPWEVSVYTDEKDLSIIGPVRDWISIRDRIEGEKRLSGKPAAPPRVFHSLAF